MRHRTAVCVLEKRTDFEASWLGLRGRLWIAFTVPFTYVFDREGDKVRIIQFRGAGIMTPSSLFFGKSNKVLVTPGLFEFPTR